MWHIDELVLRPVEIDFRGAALGKHRDRAVFAGGVCLINALSLVDLWQDPAQLLVCTCCGTIGCSDEGWVTLRRHEDRLLLMPPPPPAGDDPEPRAAAEYLWSEDLEPRLPVIARHAYEALRQQTAILPPWQELRPFADSPVAT